MEADRVGDCGGLSGVGSDQRGGLGGVCAVRLGRAADCGAVKAAVIAGELIA